MEEPAGVKLLLDTNALIWTLANPGRLSDHAAREIQDESNTVFVSVVSAWEMACAWVYQRVATDRSTG